MKRLKLRVRTQDDWWKYYDSNISEGGVFCPANEPPSVGSKVQLEILFVGGPRFFVQGTVMWRRPQLNDPRARAGIGIEVRSGDRSKLSYVNAWARGGVLDKRETRRLPVRLRVTYTARTGRRINFTRDISEEGLFVRSQELLDLETTTKVLLSPPDESFKPFQLSGTVARLVDEPDERGMGILIDFSSPEQKSRFASFVQRIEEEYLQGKLPDDVIS